MKGFKDAGHLLRVAMVFVLGTLAFAGVRAFLVPRSFGQYGHYRGDSIGEIAALPLVHAGHAACEMCHADVLEVKKAGKHAGVACEACHGPAAKHADDPESMKPPRPDTAVLCVRCHEANPAKPRGFPQVDSKEHSMGAACGDCHKPHSPSLKEGGPK